MLPLLSLLGGDAEVGVDPPMTADMARSLQTGTPYLYVSYKYGANRADSNRGKTGARFDGRQCALCQTKR
jgi:hypothetical protein